MKDININYEGLSFEEKIELKINYLLSLPASEATKSALLNLKWVPWKIQCVEILLVKNLIVNILVT